jgi:transaldolase
VRQIYDYYKHFGLRTEIMGASFRNVGQILALAGCDLLTISPELMAQLADSQEPVVRALDPARSKAANVDEVRYDEASFRYALNEDAMASDKLAEGIRTFAADAVKLETLMKAH